MTVDVDTTYELWDLEKPIIPPRSCLFYQEPVGVGTPNVESLTGFVARLALEHGVPTGMLILSELGPLIKPGYDFLSKHKGIEQIYSGNAARGTTRSLNGTGSTAATLVQSLETLTGRSDLRFLTLLTWSAVLPWMGLLRPVKAWCPACYEEWRQTSQVIYEPLLWTMDAVTVCPHHHQRLLLQCPHCHKQLRPLEWRSRPGYCSKCEKWLGVPPETEASGSKILSKDELKWQLKGIDNIGELIATAPRLLSAPPRVRVTKNIFACVNQVTRKNLSAFARVIGKSPRHVQLWYTGKHIPQLNTLLQVCYCLGISLLDLLTEEVVAADSAAKATESQGERQHQPRNIYRPFNYNLVQQALKAALNEFPPPPVKEVIKRLGVSNSGTLYHHFSDLCSAISSRHADYKKAKFLEERQRALEAVLESDEYPPHSLKEVSRRLKYSQTTLLRHFPDLCHAISARYLSYLKAARMERIEQLCQEIWLVALELHARGMNPHSVNVGKLLTQRGAMWRKEAQSALREVRRSLGYE